MAEANCTSLILYSTLKPESGDYHEIVVSGVSVFVRGEAVKGETIEALVLANPREGEIVLNTIPATA